MTAADVRVDVVIIGGGIAGLWLLDTLQDAGYSALVLNKGALGQGQSIAAQGIIHGGTKYFGESAVPDLAPMPERWRASLTGQKGPDLSAATALADAMLMWVPPQPAGAILTGFAKGMMRRRMRKRAAGDRPSVLPQDSSGDLLDVDEAVIDVPSVLTALRNLHSERVRALPAGDAPRLAEHDGGMEITAGPAKIYAQRLILAAGAGNEKLLAAAGMKEIACQRRPLRQIIIRGMAQPIYLHCMGLNPKPLATVTSHPDGAGGYYWYVGGLLAEQGVAQTPEQLIATAKGELSQLLPGADFSTAAWSTFHVDRAEPAGHGGLRPSSAIARRKGAVIVGWPTKLALAPVLGDKILAMLRAEALHPGADEIGGLATLPAASIAPLPWREARQWS